MFFHYEVFIFSREIRILVYTYTDRVKEYRLMEKVLMDIKAKHVKLHLRRRICICIYIYIS